MILAQAIPQTSMPDHGHSLWGQTTSGEIALLILGGVFTVLLVVVFFWVTFRAMREKS